MPRISLPSPPCPHAVVDAAGSHALGALDQTLVMHLYREHGAVLLRGFSYDVTEFREFCRGFCPTAVINESPGRIALSEAAEVQSVNLGEDPFPLHPELSREPWKPDTAFFACLAPPSGGGGETTICDGVALVEALPAHIREAFGARRLEYLMPTWPDLFDYWLGTPAPGADLLAAPPMTCPYHFEKLPDGRIMRKFSRPALHPTMFGDALAFGNFLLFARYYLNRDDFPLLDDRTRVPHAWTASVHAAAEALTYAHAWQKGDILMLDNTRFMHGRRAIADVGQRKIVTYFGYLADAPRNAEEPVDPIWRRQDFMPPRNPALITR